MCIELLLPYANCRKRVVDKAKTMPEYSTSKNKNSFLFNKVMEECATSRGLFMSCLYSKCQEKEMYSKDWQSCLNDFKLSFEDQIK